jgi:hypothetical protein
MSVVSNATPVWTGATPIDLSTFDIKAVCFDLTTVNPPIGAYLLASDGTDSAIWYTPDAFAKPAQWVQGATFSGVYTDVRAAGTPGSVIVYTTASDAVVHDYNFAISGYGWQIENDVITGQPRGVYQSGRFESVNDSPPANSLLDIYLNISSATVLSVRVIGHFGGAAGSALRAVYFNTFSGTLAGLLPTGAGDFDVTFYTMDTGVTSVWIDASSTSNTVLNYINRVEIITSGGAGSAVRCSSDYGATTTSAITVGTSPGAIGAIDLTRLGGASIASADGQVKLATTLGGSYSNAPGGTLSSGQPVTLMIPIRRWDNGATQYSATDPDYLLMSSALISSESCWKVAGASGTKTDITPVAGAIGVGPNLATTYQTGSACHIALVVNNSGAYEVYVSADAGATWTLSKTASNPIYLRYKRNGSPVLYFIDGASLFVSLTHGATWLTRTLPSTRTGVSLDAYD